MTEKTENQEQEVVAEQMAQEATQQAAQENLDLTINDLSALKTIIDVAAQRGVFKPNEMAAVGTVYNKLTAFLEAVAKNQAAQPQG